MQAMTENVGSSLFGSGLCLKRFGPLHVRTMPIECLRVRRGLEKLSLGPLLRRSSLLLRLARAFDACCLLGEKCALSSFEVGTPREVDGARLPPMHAFCFGRQHLGGRIALSAELGLGLPRTLGSEVGLPHLLGQVSLLLVDPLTPDPLERFQHGARSHIGTLPQLAASGDFQAPICRCSDNCRRNLGRFAPNPTAHR